MTRLRRAIDPHRPAIAIWIDTRTGEVVTGPQELPSLGPSLLTPVVMGDPESTLFVLDADLTAPPVSIEGADGFRGFDVDELSGQVLIGLAGGEVGLIDPGTFEVRRLESSTGSLSAGTFSPDGTRVAVLATGGEVQILDIESGQRIGTSMTLDGPLVLPRSMHWATDENGGGVWIGSFIGPINFAADAHAWRRIACDVVHRDLTAEKWRTFVSDTEPQVSACS